MDGRKYENTKNQYRQKIGRFREWIVAKYAECSLNDGNIVNLATFSKRHLQDFFGHNGNYIVPVVYQT